MTSVEMPFREKKGEKSENCDEVDGKRAISFCYQFC